MKSIYKISFYRTEKDGEYVVERREAFKNEQSGFVNSSEKILAGGSFKTISTGEIDMLIIPKKTIEIMMKKLIIPFFGVLSLAIVSCNDEEPLFPKPQSEVEPPYVEHTCPEAGGIYSKLP